MNPPSENQQGYRANDLHMTLEITACIYCMADLCFQCENPDSTNPDQAVCCCKGNHGRYPSLGSTTRISSESFPFGEEFISEEERSGSAETQKPKRPVGRPRQDVISVDSGRRRAGLIAKIPKGYVCEWARLEFAGGGAVPLIGCDGNSAEALHHGPDKSTLNNEVGINLHRICHTCHNRWHELNDKYYGARPEDNSEYIPTVDYLPHNRLDQIDRAIVVKSEKWWATPKLDRTVKYREWK